MHGISTYNYASARITASASLLVTGVLDELLQPSIGRFRVEGLSSGVGGVKAFLRKGFFRFA